MRGRRKDRRRRKLFEICVKFLRVIVFTEPTGIKESTIWGETPPPANIAAQSHITQLHFHNKTYKQICFSSGHETTFELCWDLICAASFLHTYYFPKTKSGFQSRTPVHTHTCSRSPTLTVYKHITSLCVPLAVTHGVRGSSLFLCLMCSRPCNNTNILQHMHARSNHWSLSKLSTGHWPLTKALIMKIVLYSKYTLETHKCVDVISSQ